MRKRSSLSTEPEDDNDEPGVFDTPDEPEEPSPEQKIEVLYQAAIKMNERLQKLELGQSRFEKTMEARITDWLQKVESAFKASPAPQQQAPQAEGQFGFLNHPIVSQITRQFGLGGEGAPVVDSMTQELLEMQKQAFRLWQRNQLKQFSATLGVPNHHVVG